MQTLQEDRARWPRVLWGNKDVVEGIRPSIYTFNIEDVFALTCYTTNLPANVHIFSEYIETSELIEEDSEFKISNSTDRTFPKSNDSAVKCHSVCSEPHNCETTYENEH